MVPVVVAFTIMPIILIQKNGQAGRLRKGS
jgi:hypothetical protein